MKLKSGKGLKSKKEFYFFCSHCGDKFFPEKNKKMVISFHANHFFREKRECSRMTLQFVCNKCGAITEVSAIILTKKFFQKKSKELNIYKNN